MPLPTPHSREPIHHRQIECRGYRRGDGLWDVEGHLTDTKTYDFDSQFRGAVPAGEPVHEMWVRLTLDDELVIQAIAVAIDKSPFPICPGVEPNFARLKGLSIGAGFNSRVRQLLGGTAGCTHLVELMGPVATTAFQTIFPYRERLRRERGEPRSPSSRNRLLNTCHGWASSGEVVRRLWPDLYTGNETVGRRDR